MKKTIARLMLAVMASSVALGVSACGDDPKAKDTVHVYMPDGAPAIALAKFMNDGYAGADFTVVQANDIAKYVSTGKADMAIMPINAAAKLYNSDAKITMLTVNTHGNLYIVGSEPATDLAALKGKRVGVIGMGNVPDLTLKMLLSETGVEYEVSETAVQDKIAVQYKGNGGELMPLFTAGKIDYALLGEPAATTAVNKFNKSVVIDMQEQWQTTFGGSYPQACLIAKKSLVDSNKEFIDNFISSLALSEGWAAANPDATLEAVKSHMEEGKQSDLTTLTAQIINRCNIHTVTAKVSRPACEKYFRKLVDMPAEMIGTPVLTKLPDDGFYYGV